MPLHMTTWYVCVVTIVAMFQLSAILFHLLQWFTFIVFPNLPSIFTFWFIGLNFGVHFIDVTFQVRVLSACVVTHVAFIGHFPQMGHFMSLQVACFYECIITSKTILQLCVIINIMYLFVSFQLQHCWTRKIALGAFFYYSNSGNNWIYASIDHGLLVL